MVLVNGPIVASFQRETVYGHSSHLGRERHEGKDGIARYVGEQHRQHGDGGVQDRSGILRPLPRGATGDPETVDGFFPRDPHPHREFPRSRALRTGLLCLEFAEGTIYTRNGQFQVSKSNQLQTAEGYTLRDKQNNGQPITVDPTQQIDVDKDGVVQQSGQTLGQIEIGGIDNPAQVLGKMGSSYFAFSTQPTQNNPEPTAEVHQGAVEQSNVPVSDAAVRLLSIMRQFEMLQKAMSVGADMDKQAVEEVAKV